MTKHIIKIVIFLVSFYSFSQKEGANWYFGNHAGVDFNSGIPVALTDGQLNQNEGCATISDSEGNLLFYTNGIEIFNANHQSMLNGTGLLGHDSSTQSAIIVPAPGSNTIYYVFVVDYEGNSNGLTYSKIDMELDGGLGGVVGSEKNIQLATPVAEKIAATYHANGEDIWIISHIFGTNEFIAFLVTASGVSQTAVVSSVGAVNEDSIYGSGTIGYLKASPDGSRLASAISFNFSLELFDFDTATGIVSNPIMLNDFLFAYGVEFSPNSSILYCSAGAISGYRIYQYDLSQPTLSAIQSSETIVAPQYQYGALQLGIDGKIYVSKYFGTPGYLSIIHSPNEVGAACNFEENGVYLAGKSCNLGLPQFISSYFKFELSFANRCYGQPTTLAVETHSQLASATWNFGDSDSGADNTSTEIEATHIFSAPGTYMVTVDIVTDLGYPITLEKEITILQGAIANEAADMFACDDVSSDGFAVFDLSTQTGTILGNQGPGGYTVTYHPTEELAMAGEEPLPAAPYTNTVNPQTLYARVTNIGSGCYDITTFELVVSTMPTITQPEDLIACEEEQGGGTANFDLTQVIPQITGGNDDLKVVFYKNLADMVGSQPIMAPASYVNTMAYHETVYFKVHNINAPGCTVSGELDLVVNPLPDLNDTIPDYILCDANDPGNGIETFDLTTKYGQIANEPSLVLVYSYEQAGNLVTITNPAAFENTVPGEQIIFVAAENVYNCEYITHFTIRVAPAPVMDGLGPFYACETQSGKGRFDLSEITPQITGGVQGYQVAYYASEQAALDGDPDTALPMIYLAPSGIIWIKVTHTATGCVYIGSLGLVVQEQAIANPVVSGSFMECDTDGDNDGLFVFDLTLVEGEVLGTQDPATRAITYHTSASDAQSGEDPIPGPSAYQSQTANIQEIWVRIVNTSTISGCPDFTSFFLHVEQLPEPKLEGGTICVDAVTNEVLSTHILDTGLGAAGNSFVWYRDGGVIPGVSGPIHEVTEAGSYAVRVTTVPGDCVSEPMAPVTVTRSEPAAPIEASYTVTNAFSDNAVITVVVEGEGEYEYSLDYGPYQDSNVFANVGSGLHTVHIRSVSDSPCDASTLDIEDIMIIDYPKFFTPNGDGYNDSWNITTLADYQEAMIYIFDRYGKLIKQLRPYDRQGWDGTYNGSRLPSTDYWFTVTYPEHGATKEFRAHFSLKR